MGQFCLSFDPLAKVFTKFCYCSGLLSISVNLAGGHIDSPPLFMFLGLGPGGYTYGHTWPYSGI